MHVNNIMKAMLIMKHSQVQITNYKRPNMPLINLFSINFIVTQGFTCISARLLNTIVH